MSEKLRTGEVLIKSAKSGCLLSFGFTCITAVIAAVLISLFVPGAWRGRPLFSEPASISVFAAAVLGFVVGFLVKLREMKARQRGN